MIAALHDAFVALATDAALRRRFAADPDAALARFALGPAERAALCGIEPTALDRYARSLVAKRWGEVARVVPLALRVAPSLPDRYHTWALGHPAPVAETVLSPGIAEALRALPALHAELAPDEREAPYAADLYAFEVLRAASRGDGIVRTLTTRFELHAIADDLGRGLVPVDPDQVRTIYRFDRERVARRPA
jgi:hypothetical protein